MNTRFYDILTPIMRVYYRVFLGIRAKGRENVPQNGGFILCSNHLSARDPFVIATCTPRRLHFMAKAELFKNPIIGKFIASIGAFPVGRGKNDLASIREAMKILSDGNVLGIFPQGTRSRENAHTHMEAGVALIALRAGVPVVPVNISEKYRLFGKTRVTFGAPLTFADVGRKFDRETLADVTRRIEEGIWALQP